MELPLMAAPGAGHKPTRGRDFLEYRSGLMKKIRELGPIGSILIVEDRTQDADLIASALHRVYGHDVPLAFARSERELAAHLKKPLPNLIFLDDLLGRGITAQKTVPMIRKAGYEGPIVIVAAIMTRERSLELARLAVGDVVHKDDLTSARLTEAILRVFGRLEPDGTKI